MELKQDHVIHTQSGQLGGADTTSVNEASRIAAQAWAHGKTGKPIVLHFHGGLNSLAVGMAGAQRLHANYFTEAGAYPIFSVWESGLQETIRNNLKDILGDSVFQELVKKVGEWVLRKGAAAIGTKGAGAAVDAGQLRQEFDDWFSGTAPEPPVPDEPAKSRTGLKAAEPDPDELALDIESELPNDPGFEATIAGLAVRSGHATATATVTRGGAVAPRPGVEVLVDDAALDEMFGRAPAGATRGIFSWTAVAKFVAQVVIAVIRRMASGRDHGGYTTIVEEVLRAAYLAKVGAFLWHQMKKDTADAFVGNEGAGNVILHAWQEKLAAGDAPPRIVLVGHSTGAIYINHWIRHSAQLAPGLHYDVVLLAPASTADDFAAVLKEHAGLIDNLRVFAMQDQHEQQDVLVPIIYLRSLLYFVSGVVETDVDAPVIGMQRFLQEKAFTPADFPAVHLVKQFLEENGRNRGVWSIAQADSGLSSNAVKHGDFDNELTTVASLVKIIKNGY